MRILYATQLTGNGHLMRAEELLPVIREYGEVDVLYSGSQAQLTPNEPNAIIYPGISLYYSGKGKLNYSAMLWKNAWKRFFINVHEVALEKYDLVVNDYEPITARACRKRGIPIVGLSHQAALWNKDVPSPHNPNPLSQKILKNYAFVDSHIGLHFQLWNSNLRTPVIRSDVRALKPERTGPFLVYLPAYSDKCIMALLLETRVRWKLFSGEAGYAYRYKNVEIIPIDKHKFRQSLEVAQGVVCGAGFELPAESLYLGKPLLAIPIRGQLEQEYNAAGLKAMGVATSRTVSVDTLREWLNKETIIQVSYPNHHRQLVEEVLRLGGMGL